jgi:2,5-diketo-D-gluconate reductase B
MNTIDPSLRALEIQGTTVPKLGFGTWQIEGSECQEAVEDALAIGYRHIDTARAYGNEEHVGRGIAAAGVPRNEFFLTTKIWREEYAPDDLRRAAEDSLRNLQVEGLDLLLLHWPNDDFPLEETLGALIGLRDDGLIKHLGVSNFPANMLREVLKIAPVFTDQVEFHPFLGQDEIVELAVEKDFMVTAYSPLARGKVPKDATLREIGEAHGKTAGQVALRWLLGKPQVATLPKASSHERRLENFEVFDFELSDEERARIEALPKDERIIDPGFGPDWDA